MADRETLGDLTMVRQTKADPEVGDLEDMLELKVVNDES
jgi:hypothetical protein